MSDGQLDTLQGISEKEMSAAVNGDTELQRVNGIAMEDFAEQHKTDPMQGSFYQDAPNTNPFEDPRSADATIPEGMLIDIGHPPQTGNSHEPTSPILPASHILQPQNAGPGPESVFQNQQAEPVSRDLFQNSSNPFEQNSSQSPAMQNNLDTFSDKKPDDFHREMTTTESPVMYSNLDSFSDKKAGNFDTEMTTGGAVAVGHKDEPSRSAGPGNLGSGIPHHVGRKDLNAGSLNRDVEHNREASSRTGHDEHGLGSAVLGDKTEGRSQSDVRESMDSIVQGGTVVSHGEAPSHGMNMYSIQEVVSVQKGLESCSVQDSASVAQSPVVNGNEGGYEGYSSKQEHGLQNSDVESVSESSFNSVEKTSVTVNGDTTTSSQSDKTKTQAVTSEGLKRPNGSPKKSGLPTRSVKSSVPPPCASSKGWDSTVVIPPKPRPLSALITSKTLKDEPPLLKPRPASAKSEKKYGTSTKQQGYKPGGGDVKIFSEKKEYTAEPRIDAKMSYSKAPKPASPRTPPVTSPSPKTSAVKSKIGSMDKITHKPGGGDVAIMNKKPDVSSVSSKVGSKDKLTHKPGGGNVKIETKKIVVDKVTSKIGSMNNARHKPGGGDKKIETKKLEWKVESKVGSMDNAKHSPGGGDKKIETQKINWTVQSKIGSMDNAKHVPGGGDKKIESKKLEWKTESKVGSLDNAKHIAGGGTKKIETKKVEWMAESKVGSMDKVHHTPGGGDKKIETKKLDWKTESKVGSMDKVHHTPGGGNKKIEQHKVDWKVESKVGSLDNVHHEPQGGNKKIEQHTVDWKVESKVGSLDNVHHEPQGGNKKIESQKLSFKETAKAKTDHGASPGSHQTRSSTSSASEVSAEV